MKMMRLTVLLLAATVANAADSPKLSNMARTNLWIADSLVEISVPIVGGYATRAMPLSQLFSNVIGAGNWTFTGLVSSTNLTARLALKQDVLTPSSNVSVSNVTGYGFLKLSGQTNQITVAGNSLQLDGATIGGGSQTPWASDIDGAQFSLTNAFALFVGTIGSGAVSFDGPGTIIHGLAGDGTMVADNGSTAFGSIGGTGTIDASGTGDLAGGEVGNNGIIRANASGSVAIGVVYDGILSSVGSGSVALGDAEDGTLDASGDGSLVVGYADTFGTVKATSDGAIATGKAIVNSVISSTGDGAFTWGNTSGTNSLIDASGAGAGAFGYVRGAAQILGNADGSFAYGYAPGSGGLIEVPGSGSTAFGYADGSSGSGTLSAGGSGSLVFGYSVGTISSGAFGYGAFAGGNTFDTNAIISDGAAAFAFGQGPLRALAAVSTALGENAFATNDYSTVINLDPSTPTGSLTGGTFTVRAPNGVYVMGGTINAANGVASTDASAAVGIGAVGWTNTFTKNAVVYFDGTAMTYTIKTGAGTPIYTNVVAHTGSATAVLQPNGAVVISGTGGFGRATPF